MAKLSTAGVPGAAVLFGTVGLYLAYVGVKDVPFFEGLRSVLRKEQPTSRSTGEPYEPQGSASEDRGRGGRRLDEDAAGAGGNLGLKGNAARALPALRLQFPGLEMGGYRATGSVPDSDHPKGLAIDIMTTDNNTAQRIIALFRSQSGAKYWIWNRRSAYQSSLWVPRNYTGPSPHTDHVHLSYF